MAKKDEKKDDDMLTAGSDTKEIKVDYSEEVIPEAPPENPKEDPPKETKKEAKVSRPVSANRSSVNELREALIFLAFKTLEPSEFKEFNMRLPE